MSDNKTIVIEYQMAVQEVLKIGAGEAFKKYLSEDVKWHLPKSMQAYGGAVFSGIDGVEKMLKDNVGRFYQPETIEVDFRSMIAEDNLVHMHFGMQATTPNAQSYSNDYQVLYEIKDGLICNVWEYFDAHELIRCLEA